MANKPLQFILTERKFNVGKQAEKIVQVAQPTGRHRVDFRNFCDRVAKSTTFSPQEVAAVLNLATETARNIVANGDIVEIGDMGTLKPSFKSKAVDKGVVFRAKRLRGPNAELRGFTARTQDIKQEAGRTYRNPARNIEEF